MILKTNYRGITYPPFLGYLLGIWRKFMCPRHYHLFDECWSLESHDLYCDACGLTVEIKGITDEN